MTEGEKIKKFSLYEFMEYNIVELPGSTSYYGSLFFDISTCDRPVPDSKLDIYKVLIDAVSVMVEKAKEEFLE